MGEGLRLIIDEIEELERKNGRKIDITAKIDIDKITAEISRKIFAEIRRRTSL